MRRGALAGVAALLFSAGCAMDGAPLVERISQAQYRTIYNPSQFSAFAAAGPLVEVHGALPGGATPEQVVAALRLPGWWPQTPFRLVAPGEAATGQRIVLLFGAAGGLDATGLCAGDIRAGGAAPRLEVSAAFCRGSRFGSAARLSHPEALTVEDPRFAAGMRRLFSVIAPRSDPLQRGRGDRCRLIAC